MVEYLLSRSTRCRGTMPLLGAANDVHAHVGKSVGTAASTGIVLLLVTATCHRHKSLCDKHAKDWQLTGSTHSFFDQTPEPVGHCVLPILVSNSARQYSGP